MARNLPPRMHKKHRVYYYVARVDKKNKWIRLSNDYQEALYKYADLEGNLNNSGLVKDAIARYRIEAFPKLTDKTRNTQHYQLERLSKVFGNEYLANIESPHIQRYLSEREAKVSGNREIKLLAQIYRYAKVWGICNTNPCEGVFYHKEKGRDRYITDLELKRVHKASDPMYQAIIDLAYLTGMRRGDILNLKLADIRDEGIYNAQGKTGKKQLFTWTPALRNVVANAKKARKTRNLIYLFTNTHGQQISETAFNSAWRRIREKAEITDITFHDIRAKSLTDANEKGGLSYAQSLGGHENQGQTEKYIKAKSVDKVEPVR